MGKIVSALVVLIALLFLALGISVLIGPDTSPITSGLAAKTEQGAAELRCFFASGFLSWSVMLAVGLLRPALRSGMFTAVGIAMVVIAACRVPSIMLDGAVDFNMQAIVAEVLFAAILFYAARGRA